MNCFIDHFMQQLYYGIFKIDWILNKIYKISEIQVKSLIIMIKVTQIQDKK